MATKRKSQTENYGNQRGRAREVRRKSQTATAHSLAELASRVVVLTSINHELMNVIAALITTWEANRDLDQPARDMLSPFEEARRVLVASQEVMAR